MPQTRAKLIASLAGAAFLSAGAVYLIGQGGGNPVPAERGEASLALDRVAIGEVANFSPKPAPVALADVSFRDAEGGGGRLSALRGKLVLSVVGATWVGPCRGRAPG